MKYHDNSKDDCECSNIRFAKIGEVHTTCVFLVVNLPSQSILALIKGKMGP